MASNKKEAELDRFDKEFLRIFNNFQSYVQLVDSMQFFHYNRDFSLVEASSAKKLGLDGQNNSLFEVISQVDKLETEMKKVEKLSSKELNSFQIEVVQLTMNLYKWIELHKSFEQIYPEETSLAIIYDEINKWQSPWQLLLDKSRKQKDEIYLLESMHQAYQNDNQVLFNTATITFNKLIYSKLKATNTKPAKTNLELSYNSLKPFFNAKLLYGLAFLLLMIGTITLSKPLNQISLVLNFLGFGIHSAGILMRIFILERPPVSNLYETFIFVAWICVILGLITHFVIKDSNLGSLLASISGLALLLISAKFAAEGDTLEVLIAVLDSNFWLSTHVIAITVGYAGTIAAGLVGHIYLVRKMLGHNQKDLDKLHNNIYGILAFGICFSVLGTLLGGIWADQSWGRFWGWDPKENGALLIVLWTAALFHARMSGMIKKDGLALGSVVGAVIVMISWFGINLLGVGLHSYGFTSGIATAFYAYIGFELIFIITWSCCKHLKKIPTG